MTIANWCILAACALPGLTVGLAKLASVKLAANGGRYDNNNPRKWAEGLSGWQQRANAAQNNGFEALPMFIAAVLVAQQAHAAQASIDNLAMIFVALRVLYVAAYLMNIGILRTLIWSGAVASCVALFMLA
ncbi:MAPEG family protein [Undibacterium sp. Ren11W]|uniref:MAPEG family protein n=1 Tax=Undibacterium sp. Ren11W TaxID=3413045 RepID=UPI003BF1645B